MATHQVGKTFIVSISVDEKDYEFVKTGQFCFSKIMRKAILDLREQKDENIAEMRRRIEKFQSIIDIKNRQIENLENVIREKKS